MKALQKEAQRKSLELGVSVHEQLPALVKGDGDRFKQVLAYLTSNAFKQSTSAVVDINIVRTKDATSIIGITVQDAGPGMSETELDVCDTIGHNIRTKLTLSRIPSRSLNKLRMRMTGFSPLMILRPRQSKEKTQLLPPLLAMSETWMDKFV